MALHPHERPSWLPALKSVFVCPHLRNHLTLVITRAGGRGHRGICQNVDAGILRPSHVVESFIENGEVRQILHNGIRFIHDVVMNWSFQGVVHLTMLLGAAHERCKILGIRSTEGVVKTDQSAAAFHESLKQILLRFADVSCVAFVDDYNIGMFQISAARRMHRAIHHGSALREQLTPIGKKLRIVVLPRVMRFEPGPDVNVHAVGILPLRPRRALWTRVAEPRTGTIEIQRRTQY